MHLELEQGTGFIRVEYSEEELLEASNGTNPKGSLERLLDADTLRFSNFLGGGAVALVATQSINEKNPTDWSDVKLYMEFRREYASLAEGYFLTDTADAGTIYIHKDDIELKSRETLVNTDFGDATHLRELLEQSHLTEEDLAAIQAALVRPEAIEERDKLAEQIKDLERLNEQMAELKQQIDSTPQMPERIL